MTAVGEETSRGDLPARFHGKGRRPALRHAEALGAVFGSVSCVRPASAGPAVIRDAAVAAG